MGFNDWWFGSSMVWTKDPPFWMVLVLPLKNATFINFLGNMGYMSVKDENFPRAWSFKG